MAGVTSVQRKLKKKKSIFIDQIFFSLYIHQSAFL